MNSLDGPPGELELVNLLNGWREAARTARSMSVDAPEWAEVVTLARERRAHFDEGALAMSRELRELRLRNDRLRPR
jgi:hypothetical protein